MGAVWCDGGREGVAEWMTRNIGKLFSNLCRGNGRDAYYYYYSPFLCSDGDDAAADWAAHSLTHGLTDKNNPLEMDEQLQEEGSKWPPPLPRVCGP